MKKIILMVFSVFAVMQLSGCVLTTSAKYTADQVCAMTTVEREVIKTELDTATKPHKVRIFCNAQ